MKVTILEPFGYCSGVERAIKMAMKTKDENPNKNVVILGMLVHNQDTLIMLEKYGIKTLYNNYSSLEELVDEIKEQSIVILTAHGHSKSIEQKLLTNGHKIIDATCPFVKKSLIDITNAVNNGDEVIYVGVDNHPESNAALSISNKVHLINIKAPEIPKINTLFPLVITQTTLSEFDVENIFNKIKILYPHAKFATGVCNASTSRQKAILSIDKSVDMIYVVGGQNSNNSKTLFNLAKQSFPDKHVELISNANDITKKDLIGLSHIAISSGASTPKEIINEIKDKLLN